jgi:flagellar basal-body rod modification protein FlgD
LSTVRAIATNPADGSVSVEVDGSKTVLLTDIKRVGI